jgi:hypothetical protein
MKRCSTAVITIGALVFGQAIASAAMITIGASKDVTIFQNNVNNSSGGGNGLFAGTNGTSSPRRALIAFDIADNVPAGATISGVQLTLTLGQIAGMAASSSATIGLFDVSEDWGEGTAETSNPLTDSIGGQGQGAAATGGDATWNDSFYSATSPIAWTHPGGDFSATASASNTITGAVTGTAYTWGSTTGMVGDVQAWLDTPSSNFGWMLKNSDETDATTFLAFYSRNTATSSFHPQLTITYTAVPEPSSLVLAAAAFGFLWWRFGQQEPRRLIPTNMPSTRKLLTLANIDPF